MLKNVPLHMRKERCERNYRLNVRVSVRKLFVEQLN